jgi:hypothetical protein
VSPDPNNFVISRETSTLSGCAFKLNINGPGSASLPTASRIPARNGKRERIRDGPHSLYAGAQSAACYCRFSTEPSRIGRADFSIALVLIGLGRTHDGPKFVASVVPASPRRIAYEGYALQ